MGQEIAVQQHDVPAEPTKWISPSIISCLDAPEWDRREARRALARANVDVEQVRQHADRMMQPVNGGWLADRLKALWQSSTPSGSLKAEVWLRETGRLLQHLPFDIAHHAIDAAVTENDGFTPTAGAILKIAKPLLDQRRGIQLRIEDLTRPPYPWERQPARKDDLCSPEEARSIIDDVLGKGFGRDAA